jgi:TrmH family RNA methyltransferase
LTAVDLAVAGAIDLDLDLALVKALATDRRKRDATGLYVIEGVRFLVSAADAGATFHGLIVSKRLLASTVGRMIVRRQRRSGVSVLSVSEDELESVARLRDGYGRGVIGIVRQGVRRAVDVQIRRRDLWLAVETARSPGNLGTLLRTCLAVGARGVFVIGDADVFDPACVRATMGALPSLEIVRLTSAELVELVQRSQATLVGASPDAREDFRSRRYHGATVFLVGSERKGISERMKAACDALVRIPMTGKIDSLNLGVAGSLVLYEAFGQRNFSGSMSKR